MILIVEGADLVGKTTLAKQISQTLSCSTVAIRWDLDGDPRIETTAMAKTTLALLRALRPDVIFDRSFLSWWAYGPSLGHDVAWMPRLIERLDGIDDVHVAVLTATDTELSRRFERTPDKWFSLDVIQAANDRFRSLASLLPSNVKRIEVDTTDSPVEIVFEHVLRSFSGRPPS